MHKIIFLSRKPEKKDLGFTSKFRWGLVTRNTGVFFVVVVLFFLLYISNSRRYVVQSQAFFFLVFAFQLNTLMVVTY